MANTKNDFISGAYEQMRISGLTVLPSASDNALALRLLENMMQEFAARNIDVGYNFEDEPESSSYHNVERKFWQSIEMLLADRLLPAFGKTATPAFLRNRIAAQSFLSSQCALVRQAPYPSRMPRGSGLAKFYDPQDRYYGQTEEAPLASATNKMYIGDIDDFVEHFDAYLNDGEDVASYTLTADTGLTIESESLSSPDISYQVKAVGGSDGSGGVYQVKIVATTTDGRVTTRIINFELTSADVIDA